MRARCHVLLGHTAEAAADYQSAFQGARRRGDLSTVAEIYREMCRYGVGTNLKSPALMRLAFDLHKAGEFHAAADAYWQIETSSPGSDHAELAAIRRAELLWEKIGDVNAAKAVYERLLSGAPDGEWRELAEARLRSMQALTGKGAPTDSPSCSPIPGPASSSRPARASSRRRSHLSRPH